MKNAKNILTLIIGGYFLLAAGGLSLFHHLCSCNSEVITSVIVEQSCCSVSHDATTSCHADRESNSCGEDGCENCNCETQIEVLAIDETINVENTRISIPSITLFASLWNAYNVDFETEVESKQLCDIDYSLPPITGKHIIILHQSIKIPGSIS